MAACASFLKPLVGRMLKINSSIGYSSYPSGGGYNRSGRTPLGTDPIGSKYARNRAAGKRGHGFGSQHDGLDEFELHTKKDHRGNETRVEGAQQLPGCPSRDYPSAEAVDAVPSDTNSEEIILQKQEPGHGIVMTRDVTVRYSKK